MPFLSGTPHGRGQVQVHQQAPPTKLSPYAAYNLHAENCSPCRHPLDVVRRGEQLCDEGHRLAVEVAQALYIAAGEKASRYGSEGRHVALLVNFAGVNGPVYELCLAIDSGLNKPTEPTAVHYVYPRTHEQRESRHNHSVHYGSPSSQSSPSSNHSHYIPSSSARPRRESRDETPRRSGNIRVNIPIEYGREASYYEEFSHSNGGRVTTKYYHTETPRPLTRANTHTEVSKPARKSTVHFNPEVRYYT